MGTVLPCKDSILMYAHCTYFIKCAEKFSTSSSGNSDIMKYQRNNYENYHVLFVRPFIHYSRIRTKNFFGKKCRSILSPIFCQRFAKTVLSTICRWSCLFNKLKGNYCQKNWDKSVLIHYSPLNHRHSSLRCYVSCNPRPRILVIFVIHPFFIAQHE